MGKYKRYQGIRGKLKTGDLLLFSSRGFFSSVIKLYTRSNYSHVGIVYKCRDEDLIFIFESTTLNNGIQGPYPMLLKRKIAISNGTITYRPLNKPISYIGRQKLKSFRQRCEGKHYEQNKIDLVLAGKGHSWSGGSGDKSFFCSELVVRCLQVAGVIKQDIDAQSIAPNHLSDYYGSLSEICRDGYFFGKEIKIL